MRHDYPSPDNSLNLTYFGDRRQVLIGENSCEWAVWFKAHYQDWTRTPSEFNQTEWMLNHTALLNKRKANWKQVGFDVNIEGQNSFELHGRSATLAGQPDLITRRDEEAVIIDAKTRHESPSHIVQVMIYLCAIPGALEPYRNLKLSGQVTYLDHTARIPAEAVDDQFIRNLGALIRRLAYERPAKRVPSEQECRFCDITAMMVRATWRMRPIQKRVPPQISGPAGCADQRCRLTTGHRADSINPTTSTKRFTT